MHEKIKKLVMAVWNDDLDAFAVLYSMTCDNIYNYCKNFMKSNEDTERAVIYTYSDALNNILQLTDPSLFEIWLLRIAFNTCYEMLLSSGDPDLYSRLNPEDLEALPFVEKQIFFLHDYRQMEVDEIASALGLSQKKVKMYLEQARHKILELKQEIAQYSHSNI